MANIICITSVSGSSCGQTSVLTETEHAALPKHTFDFSAVCTIILFMTRLPNMVIVAFFHPTFSTLEMPVPEEAFLS